MIPEKTILSLEQALALPYATLRMAQLGWRVIRIEMPADGEINAGDPNRYIGADLGKHDLHSYFIAPNAGKEAITLNLKEKRGQELLQRIIRELKVDVFMCNTLPKRYAQLGIRYEDLREANPELIWCGISAMGPAYPDRAGYDPALQALLGFTYLTGEPDGKPVPCGIPVIDLKAGDEAFTQVLLAMQGGKKEIHISMAQCAASWLITALPQLNFVKNDDELFRRAGNEHRSFIPCNVYPTSDGFVYLAIGNDKQWAKFTSTPEFSALGTSSRITNEGRLNEKDKIYSEIGAISRRFSTSGFFEFCLKLNLSVSPVNSVKEVAELEYVEKAAIKTKAPDGRLVTLSPPSHPTTFLESKRNRMEPAPGLGEHTKKILEECGLAEKETKELTERKII